MSNMCPYCEVGVLEGVTYTEHVKVGRKAFDVPGLTKMVCPECESESVPLEVSDLNSRLISAAMAASRGTVSRGLLLKLRETWGLAQKDASKILGAGDSAFAKWESGQSELSTPSALLVQCAVKFPEVMRYLAELADIKVEYNYEKFKSSDWERVVGLGGSAEPTKSPGFLYIVHSAPLKVQSAKAHRGRGQKWSSGLSARAGKRGNYVYLEEAA